MATRHKLISEKDLGIADDKVVQIDSADVADNDYAKFTVNGLEGRSYAEVLTDLGLSTDDSPQFTGIELGHASDTTLTRKEAGEMNIEGKQVLTEDNEVDVTEKRIQPRSSTTTSTATLTPALATANVWQLTAQAEALTIAEPTGTPVLGETIHIMIKDDGTARAINWNSAYKAVGEALLETTTAGKWIKAIATYNGTDWLTSSVNEV
jgi:hypothetical protein